MAVTQKFLPAIALLLATLMLSVQVRADDAELHQYVDNNTQNLVKTLNEKRGLYEKDPDAFYQSMEQALQGFVDFRRIAARVMGRYARQATPEQRDRFVEKFKRSLFNSYAKALVDADQFSIRVKEAVIDPSSADRASVSMEVESASGNKYPVTYSMYRNDEGRWLMENVIVEGVNIGLAFRDRFAQDMEANNGDVEAVIKGWDNAVKSIGLEEKVKK